MQRSAQKHMGEPVYLDRDAWGARPPKSVRLVLPHQFTELEVHHSATEILGPVTAARSFQRYHMDARNWKDLFYNFLVHPNGTILEGRGWETSPRAENLVTVCFIGDYRTDPVTPEMETSFMWLRDAAISRMPQLDKPVVWHGQRDPGTACPGQNLKAWITDQNNNMWSPTEAEAPMTPQEREELQEELDDLTEMVFGLSYKTGRLVKNVANITQKLGVLDEETAAALRRARAIRNKLKES